MFRCVCRHVFVGVCLYGVGVYVGVCVQVCVCTVYVCVCRSVCVGCVCVGVCVHEPVAALGGAEDDGCGCLTQVLLYL